VKKRGEERRKSLRKVETCLFCKNKINVRRTKDLMTKKEREKTRE